MIFSERSKVALFAVVALMGLVLPLGAQAVAPGQGGNQGQIAFVSDSTGNSEIYIINADGSNRRQLTNNTTVDWHPALSSTGERIVFQSMVNNVFNVFVMNVDGGGLTQVTNWTMADTGGMAGAQHPVWSPDGTRIAVSSETVNGTYIYLMNADGSNLVQLVEGRDPSWSPDGTRVAYDKNGHIWVANVDGMAATQLTSGEMVNFYPAWSPDGARIAFTKMSAEGGGIFIMNVDGSGVTPFAANVANGLCWSPDSQKLAFGVEGWVATVNLDGSNLQWVAEGYQPSWSKAGQVMLPPTPTMLPPTPLPPPTLLPPTQPPLPTMPPLVPTLPAEPTLPPIPTAPPPAATTGKIAFTVFNLQYNKYDIYIANADGSNRHMVADQMRQPAFDPGGGRLAANGDRHNRMHLFVMNADGSNQVEVTLHIEDGQPSWSHDGNRLVFASTMHADRRSRLYVLDKIPGSERERQDGRVLNYGAKEVGGKHPNWMPDGRIMYTGCDEWAGGGNCGLMIIAAEGGIAQQLTRDQSDMAPDVYGNRAVFMSQRDGNWELYAMNIDGSNLNRLTNSGANDGLPVWSPDGNAIAFISDEGGVWAIWAINPDGSNRRKLFDLQGGFGPDDYDWTNERIDWAP